TFRDAAAKFLTENQHKRSLERDQRALAVLDPFIGSLLLQRVHHDTLAPYIRSRLHKGRSPGTINRDLAVVRRILNLATRLWRDETQGEGKKKDAGKLLVGAVKVRRRHELTHARSHAIPV
ncbi:MAG: integrase, partial [Gammaproteobacteria bacterium]|nr:integrase [Gammaproteobacteria bacterium]